ncbi:WD repeat containing protein 49 [Echinococcus multilocularis]|uniref:WD repeat containing protein 49 n=1 Tax=Echinococcus multilocularis TaxID=6211 RepID=A0A068YH37_ECHMU|nr:WD repeat containing protein 49 [Echinococcus multilocularis]
MKLTVDDLMALKEAFSGYNGLLALNKEQFIEALTIILNRGSRQEYDELFDKIDVSAEGVVDWDKIAAHFIVDCHERDERSNSISVPQWKELKTLHSPHKDNIQKITRLNNFERYLSISKEGLVVMYGLDMHPQKWNKISTDLCKQRDLWVSDAVTMPNINKMAFLLSSREILFSTLNLKLELQTTIKLVDLPSVPVCADYWYNSENHNEAFLLWGDTDGYVNIIFWRFAQTILFERPPNLPQDKEESTIVVHYLTVSKSSEAAIIRRFKIHNDWVRQVRYIPQLDCLISCATQWNSALAISWLERLAPGPDGTMEESFVRTLTHVSRFCIHQGINGFDYHSDLSLIATAGINYHINLWNPYVTSKPSGLLRGHSAPVVAVQFQTKRQQLLSFSKDNVLRVWDTQLQVCIQKLAGIYPKSLDDAVSALRTQIYYKTYYHEEKGRLFIAYNAVLGVLQMKPEITDRIFTHNDPVVGVVYNPIYNQIVTVGQGGRMSYWLVESGQRVKNLSQCHGNAEITCLSQDATYTRLYTGSTNGTVKVWDMNGSCLHTLVCPHNTFLDVAQVVILKRAVIVMGGSKHFIIFKSTNFCDHYVFPSEWKSPPQHKDDVMAGCPLPPHSLITGSYDGELIVWNTNSELFSRRMNQRCSPNSETYSEMLYNISRVVLLTARTTIKLGSSKGANVVSCGGSGYVRFWNAYECILVGEFAAHPKVSSIVMAVDPSNGMLATADVEGNVKVWNIATYCLVEGEEKCMYEPPLLSKWKAHLDLITDLVFCVRPEKRAVLTTASSDCSVCLWSIDGQRLGIFGQAERWKLDLYQRDMTTGSVFSQETKSQFSVEKESEEDSKKNFNELDDFDPFASLPGSHFNFRIKDVLGDGKITSESDLARIQNNLTVWDKTCLGEEYRKIRLEKPMRQQPRILVEMPFLYADKLGRPNYGPYYSVGIRPLMKQKDLQMPDFMINPVKYFANREDYTGTSALYSHSKLPLVEKYVYNQINANSSVAPKIFTEKDLFPKYLLEFDEQLHQVNQYVTRDRVSLSEHKVEKESMEGNSAWRWTAAKRNSLQKIPENA